MQQFPQYESLAILHLWLIFLFPLPKPEFRGLSKNVIATSRPKTLVIGAQPIA